MTEVLSAEFLWKDGKPSVSEFVVRETINQKRQIIKGKKIYPNDPCPCGSGKKYKKCCGK